VQLDDELGLGLPDEDALEVVSVATGRDGPRHAILSGYDALNTEQASGPGGNAKKPRTWSGELDVEPMDGQFEMHTNRLET
jgi:hypothetical protein